PVESGTYAVVPRVRHAIGPLDQRLEQLRLVQAAVAFVYSYSGRPDGRPYLEFEHATMVVLTPALVPTMLVGQRRSNEHEQPPKRTELVSGFEGIYNFVHHFWAATGSRVYPPLPHLTINLGQDLSSDWEQICEIAWYQLLFKTLSTPASEI